jgi:hypothetical protein
MGFAFVLELTKASLHVIRCCAQPTAIDRLSAAHDALARVADNEALLLVAAGDVRRQLASITAEIEITDPSAIVIDHTDAFAVTTLSGSFREAMARVSAIPVPTEGFLQGLVAGVPCKVIVAPGHLHLLAPSTYRDHVRERLFAACADLAVRERSSVEQESVESMTIA